jgi:ankyrin repeat protein
MILLEPTSQLEDGIQLTNAVNQIRNFIDERPGILKEGIGNKNVGCLPLHWVCAEKCPLQVVQLVYEKYPEAIKIKKYDYLPLHCAVAEEPDSYREDVIRFLISKNPDARTHCPDDCGQIPLHYFCQTTPCGDSEETLDELLLNCPETLWTKRSDDNRNALQISLNGSYASLTSMLRKKIVHYAREFKNANSHENFLHLFRSNCFDRPTLKLYCEEWPDFAYFDLERGARPLHIACSAAPSDFDVGLAITYLITRAPDVLAIQDNSGCTPLHLFLRVKDLEHRGSLISFILKANPKVLTARDNEGCTPLLVASQSNLSLDIIYYMLRFDPQLNLSSSWFSDSKMCVPIQRKRKR